eukprot:5659807-Prymnesium_polylepis.1
MRPLVPRRRCVLELEHGAKRELMEVTTWGHGSLNQNQAELGVGVATELVQVLAHGHSLLDQAVQILRDLGSEACEDGTRRP